jgi:hypothetical protein
LQTVLEVVMAPLSSTTRLCVKQGRTTGTGFSYFYTPEKREQLASEAERYRNLQDKITEALE